MGRPLEERRGPRVPKITLKTCLRGAEAPVESMRHEYRNTLITTQNVPTAQIMRATFSRHYMLLLCTAANNA